jgi:hypothetical protein
MLERRKGSDVPPGLGEVRDRIAFRRQTDDFPASLPRLNLWWKVLCQQKGLDANAAVWQDFGSHIVQLVKNGLMSSERVEVWAVFAVDRVGAIVQEKGPFYLGPSARYGDQRRPGARISRSTIDFADAVIIESQGRRFEKRFQSQPLRSARSSSIVRGTRIGIFKRRPPAPSALH